MKKRTKMTCIIGYIDNDVIHIAGDSAGSDENSIQIRKDPKVFASGPFVMGFTSSFRMGQLLMSSKFKPTKQRAAQSDYDYMVTSFIDSVRECFKDGGYLQKYEDGDEKGGTFLVGYKGVLYYVEDDFQVGIAEEDYNSCGCGSDLAKGALFALSSVGIPVVEKIETALNAASRFSTGVAPPYNFVSMSKKESEDKAKAIGTTKTLKKPQKEKK